MNVQILSRELIKPSIPTPLGLKKYKISLIDELAPLINIPLILYYPATKSTTTCNDLKISLATTLTKFYVLAGRYMNDNHMVDCSDQGAEFVEAKVDMGLNDLLAQRENLKVELLNNFLPIPIGATDDETDPLLAIQVNVFDCGGLAIGLCVTHRVTDISTVCTFIKEWANVYINRGRSSHDDSVSPSFDSPNLFPGKNVPGFQFGLTRAKENIDVHKIVTKIFHFSNKAISSVRGDATRVQSIFGIILKALVDTNSINVLAIQVVNMRGRSCPPLSKHLFGNLFMVTCAELVASEREMEIPDFAKLLGSSVKSALEDCARILPLSEEGERMLINPVEYGNEIACTKRDTVKVFSFSSWCRFPIYEADFGWGKPVWVSSVNIPVPNLVVLIDEKGGEGIEAWVNLNEMEMRKFETSPIIKNLTT